MNKKILILAVAALIMVAVLVPAAFANNNYGEWYDQMFEWHNQSIDSAVESGEMSEQQAEEWRGHFNYMQDFHQEQPMGSACGGYYGDNNYETNNNASSADREMIVQ